MSTDELVQPSLASACRVTTRNYDGVAVLHIKGALNVTSSRGFAAELAGGLDNDSVLFDLTDVRAIDPVGIGALVGVIWRVHEQGGGVAVTSSRPPIVQALRDFGVDRLVYLADSPVSGLGWLSHFHAELQRLSGADGLD